MESSWKASLKNLRLTWPLLVILLLAAAIRLGYTPFPGHDGDLRIFDGWTKSISENGLRTFYRNTTERAYPPLLTMNFGMIARLQASRGFDLNDPIYIARFKIAAILGDLALITAAYAFLQNSRRLRWLVPGFLALHPGLVVTSGLWGQAESLFVIFLVLALLALNRDRPLFAWAFFALALMTKQQSLILGPLLLLLSFRRYGLVRTILGLIVFGGIVAILLVPFLSVSGLDPTLAPYLKASDQYPNLTNNAYNFWYFAAWLKKGSEVQLFEPGYQDYMPFWESITYKQVGYALFGLYMLLILAAVWRQAKERREFVWASAIYLGVFVWLTQVHERYLFTAAVLTAFAIVQDRRTFPITLGLAYAYSYNAIQVLLPVRWLGFNLWPSGYALPLAGLNMAMLCDLTWTTIAPCVRRTPPEVLVLRTIGGTLALAIALNWIGTTAIDLTTGNWLQAHVTDFSRVAYENSSTELFTLAKQAGGGAATWEGLREDRRSPPQLVALIIGGTHYLLLGEDHANSGQFSARIRQFTDQGAELLYDSGDMFGLAPRRAILWTFRPQHVLNLNFNNELFLIGYDVQQDGKDLLLYWYTRRKPLAAYQLFVHLLDPQTSQLVAQGDIPLGRGRHPSDTWRPDELVFEPVAVPPTSLPSPLRLDFGLYQLDTGRRVTIQGTNGPTDHFEVLLLR